MRAFPLLTRMSCKIPAFRTFSHAFAAEKQSARTSLPGHPCDDCSSTPFEKPKPAPIPPRKGWGAKASPNRGLAIVRELLLGQSALAVIWLNKGLPHFAANLCRECNRPVWPCCILQ